MNTKNSLNLHLVLLLVEIIGAIRCSSENVTIVSESSFQRILSRKRRFLIFPPGAAIVATMSYTKTLVPTSPSGINTLGEYDVFYALPTKVSEWYPTTTTMKPAIEEYEDNDDNGNDGGTNTGAVNQNDANGGANADSMTNTNDGDAANGIAMMSDDTMNLGDIPGLPNLIVSDPNFNVGKHPGEIYVDTNTTIPRRRYEYINGYYNDKNDAEKRQQWSSPAASTYQNYYYQPRPSYTSNTVDETDVWTNRNSPNPLYSEYSERSRNEGPWRTINQQDYYRNSNRYYSNGSQIRSRNRQYKVHKWPKVDDKRHRLKMHQMHRERRDIYEQIQQFVTAKSFDVKFCILRMICEANHYLLPPGKSLFEDIFRVLFTIPLRQEFDDEYANAMRMNETECQTMFSEKCRYSLLGYILSKDRPII